MPRVSSPWVKKSHVGALSMRASVARMSQERTRESHFFCLRACFLCLAFFFLVLKRSHASKGMIARGGRHFAALPSLSPPSDLRSLPRNPIIILLLPLLLLILSSMSCVWVGVECRRRHTTHTHTHTPEDGDHDRHQFKGKEDEEERQEERKKGEGFFSLSFSFSSPFKTQQGYTQC